MAETIWDTAQHEPWTSVVKEYRLVSKGQRLVMIQGPALVPWHGPGCTDPKCLAAKARES